MIMALAVILIVGTVLGLVASEFVDIEEETEGTWIEPFRGFGTAVWDFMSLGIRAVTGIFKGAGSFFGRLFGFDVEPSDVGEIIEIENSFDNKVDGKYESTYFKIINETERPYRWNHIGLANPNYIELDWDTEIFEIHYATWFWFTDIIYTGEIYDEEGGLIKFETTLEGDERGLNEIIIAEVDFEELEDIPETKDSLVNTLNEGRELVRNSIGVFGLLPAVIGLPIMILIVVSLIIAIIKLIPFI